MVTVTVIKSYKDIEKSLLFYPGEVHEVTKDRADSLAKAGVVKVVYNIRILKENLMVPVTLQS